MDTKNREYQETKVCPKCKRPHLPIMSILDMFEMGMEQLRKTLPPTEKSSEIYKILYRPVNRYKSSINCSKQSENTPNV